MALGQFFLFSSIKIINVIYNKKCKKEKANVSVKHVTLQLTLPVFELCPSIKLDTRKINFFSLLAQYTIPVLHMIFPTEGSKNGFIHPAGAIKCTLWPTGRKNPFYDPLVWKKVVCDTVDTLILLVWLLASFYSGIRLHSRKINYLFLVAQYTILILQWFLFSSGPKKWI